MQAESVWMVTDDAALGAASGAASGLNGSYELLGIPDQLRAAGPWAAVARGSSLGSEQTPFLADN
eukprot:11178819-Lingulodinium_polyedra.AAC.1